MSFFFRRSRRDEEREILGGSTQMGVSFPTATEKHIIQQAVADEARLTGVAKGAVISGILQRALIPIEESEAWLYERCLLDAAEDRSGKYPRKLGISNSLEMAFAGLCSGMHFGEPAHKFGLPYVLLAYELAAEEGLRLMPFLRNGSPDPRFNLVRDYRAVKEILEEEGREVDPAVETILQGDNHPVRDAYRLVLDNWDLLRDKRATYQYLAYLTAATENWADTAGQRARFKSACATVGHDVSTWKEAERRKREEARRAAALEEVPLADGAVALLPRGWVRLSPEKAATSRFVGVVEIKNPGIEGTPHFAFFLEEHPAYEITEDEREAVLRDAATAWPPLRQIIDEEVEPEYGPDGGITNHQEVLNSPMVGLFHVMDEAEVSEWNKPPYGAVVRRQRGGASN